FVGCKKLRGEPPEVVQRILDPTMTLVRPIPQPYHPTRAEPEVIARLLDRLGGNTRQPLVLGLQQPLVHLPLPPIQQELPDTRPPKTPVGLLHQGQIENRRCIPEERELVPIALPALNLARI